ncbi:MAG: DUF2809 domain-containing protein [Planctomycetota bacterium]
MTALGLLSLRYRGAAAHWLHAYGAAMFYEVFWILAVRPRARPALVAGGVFLATCGVETLQLWHPAWLDAIRATYPCGILLGGHFDWRDFPHYSAGCLLGLGLARFLGKQPQPAPQAAGAEVGQEP